LSVAAGYDYDGIPGSPQGPAYQLPAFSVCPLGDTAGVDHHNVGRGTKLHDLKTPVKELAAEGRGLSEIQLAAQGMKCDFWHHQPEKKNELPGPAEQLWNDIT